jgi:chemotaxis protein CheX
LRVDFVNPFISAAADVVKSTLDCDLDRGVLRLDASKVASDDVTVVIGVTGDAEGIVMYGMSERTAKQFAQVMLGQRMPVFDALAESAVAELGNMIAGSATVGLEKQSYACRLTPPTLLYGRGTMISLIDINRLVIPLSCKHGTLEICVALRDNKRTAC